MKQYIIKRILSAIPLLIIISFVCFVFINLIPSDPAEVALRIRQVPIITEEAVAQVRAELGLDKPYLIRYISWLADCLRGDFGISYVNPSRTVAGELMRCFPATLQLAGVSFVMVLVLSIPIGVLCAVYKDGVFDRIMRAIVFMTTAMPAYWVGLLLIWLVSIKLDLLPTSGSGSFKHLILPSFTVSLSYISTYIRLIRNNMLENMKQDYVLYANVRGIPNRQILLKHILKNSMHTCIVAIGMSIPQPILRVDGLNVELKIRNKQKKLVENVSFEVEPGQCLGILGESGSGKSMTVKAILGLLDRQFRIEGQAWFEGKDLCRAGRDELRRLRGQKIGMVLQNPMTCFDPLYRIGSQMAETFAAHTDWDRAKIREISLEVLEKMRIHNPEEVLGQYPHQLSGGMLQRIMIGLALAMKPALLVADEPTTAIDAITQAEILKEFQRIKEESHTAMIFISHDLGAVSKIADEIVVMNGGKLVEQGDFEHILRHAKDPYTRMLAETRRSVMERYRLCLDNQEELCLN